MRQLQFADSWRTPASGKLVFVTGLSGVGKSTLSRAISDRIPATEVLSYGQVLFECCRAVHPQLTYAQFRRNAGRLLHPCDISAVDLLIARKVRRLRRKKCLTLLELHTVTKTEYGFRAMPFCPDMLSRMRPDGIIHLSARRKDLRRRLAPAISGRVMAPAFAIEGLGRLQEQAALTYGCAVGCPVFIIDAHIGPEAVVENALMCLESIGIIHASEANHADKSPSTRGFRKLRAARE